MLKGLGYGGVYRDDDISVSVMLENPLVYGLEATTLVLCLDISSKDGTKPQDIDDFTFYLMDEANRLYNTRVIKQGKSPVNIDADIKTISYPDALICAKLRSMFIFQDMRLAIYRRGKDIMQIIKLKH